MFLGVMFIISFALIFMSLSRVLKDPYGRPNTTIAAVIALSISGLIIYSLNRTYIDVEYFFYKIYYSGYFFGVAGILLFVLIIYLISKLVKK